MRVLLVVAAVATGLINPTWVRAHEPIEDPAVFRFTRTVANVDWAVIPQRRSQPKGVRRLPSVGSADVWFGRLHRRLPNDPATGVDRSIPFLARYRGTEPESLWLDQNLNGDLSDDPPLTPYDYPEPSGAKAFVADLHWNAPYEGRNIAIAWKVRVILQPILPPEEDPHARWQMVEAMTGDVRLDGAAHHAFLFDGNGDGLYTKTYGDGMFVDLNDDGQILLDPMTAEFIPFGVPVQVGSTIYETERVSLEGNEVQMRPLGARAPLAQPTVGSPAPDFLCRATDGREMQPGALRGRPVAVYFWAAWCGVCADHAAMLRVIYDRYRERGFEVLSISLDDDRALLDAFESVHREPWPVSFQGRKFLENAIARLYGVEAMGTVFLIDPQGTLDGVFHDFTKLDHRLSELLTAHTER